MDYFVRELIGTKEFVVNRIFETDFTAVAVSAFIHFIINGVLYSFIFGNAFVKAAHPEIHKKMISSDPQLRKKAEEQLKRNFPTSFFGTLIMTWLVSLAIYNFQVVMRISSYAQSFKLGLFLSLCIAVPLRIQNGLWEDSKIILYVIRFFEFVINLTVVCCVQQYFISM
eukprot:TRINITY_DN15122_c0_g1_i1.p1 TRINITY_DN15122_c0_g1~~TRINITY_DN15122_c0_g1_i1.p1  ORF type:complete len:169 (+),score=38.32 TRINITY_DN15122_c0_g1_i1:56-562(+)